LSTIFGKLIDGSEFLPGTDGDDSIWPLGGSDSIDGKKGVDTVFIAWSSENFKISTADGATYLDTISGASKSDKVVLRNVEFVQFSDKKISLEVSDTVWSHPGSEVIDTGPGIDTVIYPGLRKDYVVKLGESGVDVSHAGALEGSDWLVNVERLTFKDQHLALDIQGHAGFVAKVIGAVFGASAVRQHPDVVGLGLSILETHGYSQSELMNLALQARLGPLVNQHEAVVDLLFFNLVGQLPSADARQPFVALLDSHQISVNELALFAAEHPLNLQNIELVGLATQGLPYLPAD